MDDLKQVEIYTDGACTGNPGPGGYAAVLSFGQKRKEISGGFRLTTSNRMELWAAIAALGELRFRCAVTVRSDSQYLVESVTKGWVARWRANGWMRNKNERAVNADLWETLLDICAQHNVSFVWVRGHAGDGENERCDRLAVCAARGSDLPPDDGYERASVALDL